MLPWSLVKRLIISYVTPLMFSVSLTSLIYQSRCLCKLLLLSTLRSLNCFELLSRVKWLLSLLPRPYVVCEADISPLTSPVSNVPNLTARFILNLALAGPPPSHRPAYMGQLPIIYIFISYYKIVLFSPFIIWSITRSLCCHRPWQEFGNDYNAIRHPKPPPWPWQN